MVAQVHSHWVAGSRFMSNKTVERMGTSNSLTKAMFVSSEQLQPRRPACLMMGRKSHETGYQLKNSK